MTASTRTTCPYCGVGCGVLANVAPDGGVEIRGDSRHPSNFGRLCSKGSALGETVDLDGRLLYPEIRGKRVSWDAALTAVAEGFARIIRDHGPDAVAFYVSGQLLTEDYYVANKLMKGFIGSANIDTNSRLCMASSVAGHKRAFGSDTVPGNYTDLELANLIVLVGSNTAWCHPVVFQRITQAKKNNPDLKIVVIDPRRTQTCDIADLHLAVKPGTDTTLFNGLLVFLHGNGDSNPYFINTHTEGMDAALQAALASAPSVEEVALRCGLAEEDVARFYRWFSCTEKVVSVYSQGVNQSSCGTDKVNSIINCHLLTGRVGRPGMGPFSLTGQPNAMGGREVGGLANQLAAHMEIDNAEHRALVQRFWSAPVIADHAGLKAVDLFAAIGSGRVKAVWIMATNPVVSLPDADAVRKALQGCELVVVSDCMRNTDTTQWAHILLPATAWGEKDGTVTNSERRISRQRKFLTPPADAKPDWWIIAEAAKRMGFGEAFDYDSPAQIFREYAALSGAGNAGSRDFDISGLALLSDDEYQAMPPRQWPVNARHPQGTERMFGDGRFFTPSGRARFVAITPRLPGHATDVEYPLILNTGRVRDQWHTMTRTGKSPRLSAHVTEPYVELHPEDAAMVRVKEGGLARLSSHWGEMIARVRVTPDQQRGSVFVPMHWNDQFASRGRVDALVNPVVDPVSGQPELKHTPVHVEPYMPGWYGFMLSRRKLTFSDASYWVSAIGKDFWRYELAGEHQPGDWAKWARELLCVPQEKVEWIDYLDKAAGRYRGARIVNNRLESCVFVAPTFELPPRTWLASLFAEDELSSDERSSLLAGRPGKGQSDAGRIVCACFGVGLNTLVEAIRKDHLTTPEAIGRALKAGTNCGSCIPELKALIASA
ncbi:MAG: molybdopterin-dependent oxidoreductase [Pseudomonadota bacterium]